MNSDMLYERIADKISGDIAEHGFSVICTETDEGMPFSYTIGLDPEVIVTGLRPVIAHHFLWSIREGAYEEGVPITDIANLPVCLKEITDKEVLSKYMCWVDNFERDVKLNQLVLSDPNGHLPWEEGYDLPQQPLLYKEVPDAEQHRTSH